MMKLKLRTFLNMAGRRYLVVDRKLFPKGVQFIEDDPKLRADYELAVEIAERRKDDH